MLDMCGLRWHGALVLEAWRPGRLHRASRVLHLCRRSPVLHGRGLGPPRHSLVLVVALARARTAPARFLLRLVLLLWWLMLLRLSLRWLMLLRLSLLMLLLLTLWLLLMLSLWLLSLILLPLLVPALVAPQAIVVIVSEHIPGSEPK